MRNNNKGADGATSDVWVDLALEADDYVGGYADVYGYVNAKTGEEVGKGMPEDVSEHVPMHTNTHAQRQLHMQKNWVARHCRPFIVSCLCLASNLGWPLQVKTGAAAKKDTANTATMETPT